MMRLRLRNVLRASCVPEWTAFVCVTDASANIVAQHQFLEELSEAWMAESPALSLGPQGFTHEGQLNEAYRYFHAYLVNSSLLDGQWNNQRQTLLGGHFT